jgi:CubicO group peptidase (beta-lactamase class C family)
MGETACRSPWLHITPPNRSMPSCLPFTLRHPSFVWRRFSVKLASALTLALPPALLCAPARAAAQGPRPSATALAAAVDRLAERAMRAELTPALGLAIAMDGRTVYERAFGMADVSAHIPATRNTLWYVASTSKSFTGFGVSLLADAGRLSFDAPIASLLPPARWPEGVDANSLTLAHFLSHTHNLNDVVVTLNAAFTGIQPESAWPGLLQHASRRTQPELVYSNVGYNVAAMVIDHLEPRGWREWMTRAVYAPAGMRETYAHVQGLDARRIAKPHQLSATGAFVTAPFFKVDATMNSAGGHLSTLGDLARWTIVQMDSGRIDGRQVFPRSAVLRSHTLISPHTRPAGRRYAYFDREGWAAGWDIGSYDGERMVSRFGGYHSVRSHLSFLPARRIGVVAVSTGDPGAALTDVLAAYAYDLEAGRVDAEQRALARLDTVIARRTQSLQAAHARDSTQRARRALQLPLPLSAYAGRYTSATLGDFVVTTDSTAAARESALRYRWGAVYGTLLPQDTSGLAFRTDFVGDEMGLSFVRSTDGVVTELRLNGQRFVRELHPMR